MMLDHLADSMDDKWRILFNEHTRAPIYTVSHYIAYLRRFVSNTAGSRASSTAKEKKEKGSRESPAERRGAAPDAIDPLSYFLRKLKLDLKVSYDSFVSDFIKPENDGLALLLRLLANLQSPTSGQLNKSSSSLNRSTSRLDDYKKSVTDEHDGLLCITFCLRVQSAVDQLIQDTDGLQRMAAGVQGSSSKARITCLEILTLCLLDSRGVDSVVEAFTVLRLQTGQSVRFKMLVSMLHTKSPSQVLFQVTCLKLFNTLLNACSSANQRVYLQHELLSAGLDLEFLTQCAEGDGLEYDDLRREIHEWKTRFIDVDALMKRLKGGHRDTMGSLFSGPDGPLQVSSRKGSVRSGQGVTYFQPEELAGNVQLGSEFRRDFVRNNRHLPGNQHRSSNGTFVADWQASTCNGSTHRQENGHVNGLAADDSDSEFISVSAQQTPLIHRKHPSSSQQPQSRQTSSGTQQRDVQSPTSTSSQNLQRDAARSVQDLSKPPPYRRHGYDNGYSSNYSNGYDHRWETKEGVAARERRDSGESIVDAYGLVIHGHDRGGNRGWGQDPESSQGVYSNWKLQYFSTPNITRTFVDGEKGVVQTRNGQVTTNGQGVGDGYEGKVYEQKRPDGSQSQTDLWNSNYPFHKRALYRGHENAGLAGRGDTTLPVRGINSPPTLVENGHEKADKEKLLRTPDPDYTPLATPRGSTRSLNTEVARVLRDFENTLRAHEPSRSPSAVEVGPVAFV